MRKAMSSPVKCLGTLSLTNGLLKKLGGELGQERQRLLKRAEP